MITRRVVLALLSALLLSACGSKEHDLPGGNYVPAEEAQTSLFPAIRTPARSLVIEGATDITFMRPFIRDFQAQHPDVSIAYHDELSTLLLDRAQRSCKAGTTQPDLYLTVATDHFVRLANDGCGQAAPGGIAEHTSFWREWRGEVFAFALEPAVFVYNRALIDRKDVPRDHLALIAALRDRPAFWNGRIGTYDIAQSGLAYNYAESDRRQSASFGRLIESFGRSHVRLYCCSNLMTAAVARGDILFAYNVQLSYAYAAQRKDPNVGVVVPEDYQAVQTRSVMIPAQARHVDTAAEFIAYLVSPRAEAIDRAMLNPVHSATPARFIPSERLLNQADVSVSMLRLQDMARRGALIREWNQALNPDSPSPVPPAGHPSP